MDFKDYYKVMGVAEGATAADIKQAYRKLARKFHPDVSKEPNAEVHFKHIGEAYAVLSDTEKRTEYDQIRALRATGGKRQATGRNQRDDEVSRKFSEFFDSVFGAGATGQGGYRETAFRRRGRDLHHRLALFLEEAVVGVQRTLTLSIPTTDARGHPSTKTKTLTVKIPPGAVPGQRLRLAGHGEPGYGGGNNGDLLLEIELAPHPLFSVAGRDILLNLPVAPWEAALGARVEVPTVTGPVKLTLPKGSVSGKKLRLKGRGLGLNPPGDQIVNLEVTLPAQH